MIQVGCDAAGAQKAHQKMCQFSRSAQLQALLVLAKAQLWSPKPQFPLTAVDFHTEWEIWGRLLGLPLCCAALKANTSVCSSGFSLAQAEFLVDWAHRREQQSLSAAARVVNPDSVLWVMPRALEGPRGVQVMLWVLSRWEAEGKGTFGLLLPWVKPLQAPGASTAGDTGQGRESLGTQGDNVVFTGFVKTHCAPALAWLRSSQTPAAMGV